MIKIEINGNKVETVENRTILDVAREMQILIPTLCWSSVTDCGGRCMLCAVKVSGQNNFLPACTTICQNGMRIDSQSDEVNQFRKHAVELILSEHIGDCEAPCRLVCPQYLDLPAFINSIALNLSTDEFAYNPEICDNCQGKCEKACRRGRLDEPIKIRKLLDELAAPDSNICENNQAKQAYQHHLGKVSKPELQNMLCSYAQAVTAQAGEAQKCLKCACAASNSCVLRKIAFELKAKQNAFKAVRSELSGVIPAGLLNFEPDKCVSCCRCVELGKKLKPGQGPVVAGRGSDAMISAPVGSTLADAFGGHEKKFALECPTGAITLK